MLAVFQDEGFQETTRAKYPVSAHGALPRLSIGREHVDFDEAKIDALKDSFSDKDEKEEFLKLIFAAISHSSNEPMSLSRLFSDIMLDET